MENEPGFKHLMRKMKQTLRNTLVSEFMATPVLDENQWEIDHLVRNKLSASKWQLFAGTCLSAFFNPESPEYRERRNGDQDLVYKASVLFTVATQQPRSRAVLMVIESGQPDLEAFLDREQVHWLRYAPLLSPGEFADQITSEVEREELMKFGQRAPVNDSEFRMWGGLKLHGFFELEANLDIQSVFNNRPDSEENLRDLARSIPRLLQEVAIDRLRPKRARSMSPAAEAISRNSSVDILVHSRGRINCPLLAIEVDGPHHLQPKQMAKDRAKDEVMDAFRIPLIRITTNDKDFWTDLERSSLDELSKQRQKLKHARFLQLIGRVADKVCRQREDEFGFALDNDAAKKAYQLLQEQLARSIFGNAYVNLDSSQEEVVRMSSITSQELFDSEMVWSEFNFYRDANMADTTFECKWPDDLRVNATEPEIVGTLQLGLSAWTLLTIPGIAAKKLETASIRVAAKLLNEEVLTLNLTSCLIQDLADKVRELIGGPSQARSSN